MFHDCADFIDLKMHIGIAAHEAFAMQDETTSLSLCPHKTTHFTACALSDSGSGGNLQKSPDTHTDTQHSQQITAQSSAASHSFWASSLVASVAPSCDLHMYDTSVQQDAHTDTRTVIHCCHILTSWFTRTETNPVGYGRTSLFHFVCLSSPFPWVTAPSRGDGKRWGPRRRSGQRWMGGVHVRQMEDVNTPTRFWGWYLQELCDEEERREAEVAKDGGLSESATRSRLEKSLGSPLTI